MRLLLLLAALAACGGPPRVLSSYGSMVAIDGHSVRNRSHDGVDLEASIGDEVIAAADGIVLVVEKQPAYGWIVTISHDRQPITIASRGRHRYTSYVHLQTADVNVGERVRRGQRIGTVGLFWASGGISHLHWQVCGVPACVLGETQDPLETRPHCYRGNESDGAELTLPLRC